MIQEIERRKSPEEAPGADGTWIQITFTLDPGHYKTLWERAESARLTVPGLVRESVVDYLGSIK